MNCHCDWYIKIFPCRLYCISCLLGRTSSSFLVTESLLNYPDSTFPCKLPHHVILSVREIISKLSLELVSCTVSVAMGSTTNEPGRTKRVAKWYHGGLASASAAMCTHPLDLLKVHLQTQQKVQLGLVGKYRTASHDYSLVKDAVMHFIIKDSHITTSGCWLFVLRSFWSVVVQRYRCIFYATVGFNEELTPFVSIKLSCIFVSGSNHALNRLFYLFSHILQQALEIFRLL